MLSTSSFYSFSTYSCHVSEVPKETKPAQRSDSVEEEKPKPSKEKVLPPVAAKTRKDNRDEENKHTNKLPHVVEHNEKKTEETVKENKPLVHKTSKDKVPLPDVHKRKDKDIVADDDKDIISAKPETVKDSTVKDVENKDLKPKTVIKGKAPVKVPVAPKTSAEKPVVQTGSKTDVKPLKTDNVKQEGKEKVPLSGSAEKATEKKDVEKKEKEVEEKALPNVKANTEPVKPSFLKSQDKETDEKGTSKAPVKRPVTPPKPRKEIDVSNQNDDKSDEETPTKPLSLRERMALLKNAAGKNDSNNDNKPSWKKTPRPVPIKTTKTETAPKNVFIQVTDEPKSSLVENGKKEVDNNDNGGIIMFCFYFAVSG